MRIIIIEKQEHITESIKNLLDSNHYAVESDSDDLLIVNTSSSDDSHELLAQLEHLLKCKSIEISSLSFGNTSLDLSSGILSCGDKSVRLTAKEFDIIRLLFKNPHHNISKERILSHVWGYDSYAIDNNVEVYIGFLRKKLATIESNVSIVAIRKLGYHLEVK